MFPVGIEYLQFNSNESLDRLTCDGVEEDDAEKQRRYPCFLPGVGEIRQTESLLQDAADREDCVIMPLYGDMPLEEQRRVLIPAKQRKIVLATNVAEHVTHHRWCHSSSRQRHGSHQSFLIKTGP